MSNLLKTVLTGTLVCLISFAKAQVPKLSSFPSAAATIFLDFDGHTVEGTGWNFGGPIYAEPATLSAASINLIFDRVAEDYRPFNINITTDSTVFLAAPIAQRMRVIFTPTSSWYGSAGGVAFVGSFTWGDDTPCWIFSSLLGNNVKKVAEAASHECGHTLGLYHQASYDNSCGLVSSYNSGLGSGEIGWAPIMGVGYSRNFTVWHNGPNSYGCSSYQDDLSIITGAGNGFGYRADDHGATAETATAMNFSGNSFTAAGIVEKTTDQDYFEFTLPQFGQLTLDAVPYNVGANNSGSDLDMQVTLLDAAQNPIGTYNPGNLLNSVIDSVFPAGTYYLVVEGKGNAYASDYGSLGSYALEANFIQMSVLPLHKLELSGKLEGSTHRLSWIIEADEEVTGQTLEQSANGYDFTTFAQPGISAREWDVVNPTNAYYRIRVELAGGKTHYSSVVKLQTPTQAQFPKLMNNPVQDKQLQLMSTVSSRFEICDANGRIYERGTLNTGTTRLSLRMQPGFYFIRFQTESGQSQTQKFIVQ